MTNKKTKLEDTFNLPPMKDVLDEIDDDEQSPEPQEEPDYSIESLQEKMKDVDKIDKALSPVANMEMLDADMDDYAKQSIDAFEDLLDFGKNVEDRHCAAVFDSAAKMMSNAISAKTAKTDKKLKVIQMQLQKEKLELEKNKLAHKIMTDKKPNGEGTETPIEGEGMIMNRNDLIAQILDQTKNEKKP